MKIEFIHKNMSSPAQPLQIELAREGSRKLCLSFLRISKKPTICLFCFSGHGNRHRASLPPDGTTFTHLALGELQKKTIPSYSYWNFQVMSLMDYINIDEPCNHVIVFQLQFHQKEASYVEMNFIIPRGSSVGLYARKNAIPTLTLNDVRDVLNGFRSENNRNSRSIVSFISA